MQGLKWNNELGASLGFEERTYRILTKRYQDLPSNGGGGGGRKKPGFDMPTNLSTIEMDKIDAEYLEAQFKIVTLGDISEQEEQLIRQAKAIEEIKKNIGVLPAGKQKFARQVLEDVKTGMLIVEDGKTFLTYIQEYSDRVIKRTIENFVINLGIDADVFYELYRNTVEGEVDTVKLEMIEKTADIDKAKAYFGTKNMLSTRVKLHTELKKFIEEQKAEVE